MDTLPDEILLRIFSFVPFKQRIHLRILSWRWSQLLHDHTLLWKVCIKKSSCQDHQLEALISAAKRVVEVDFFNCYHLTGSCLLRTGLSRLRHLTLTGTAISNCILGKILEACKNELMELNLVGTLISAECLPYIVALKKLKYISVPPEDVNGFGKRAAIKIVERCRTLRTLDCQEGYFFDGEDILWIVHANPNLTGLLIPYAFIDDDKLIFITENLRNLSRLCVCETGVTQECVQRIKSGTLLGCQPYTIIMNLSNCDSFPGETICARNNLLAN